MGCHVVRDADDKKSGPEPERCFWVMLYSKISSQSAFDNVVFPFGNG